MLRIGDTRVPTLDERVGTGAAAEPSRQVSVQIHTSRRPAPTASGRFFRPTRSTTSCCRRTTCSAGATPVVPMSAFAGKLVLVGTTAAGTYDRYTSPFDGGIAGVELHGTIADNILSSRFMRRARPTDGLRVRRCLGHRGRPRGDTPACRACRGRRCGRGWRPADVAHLEPSATACGLAPWRRHRGGCHRALRRRRLAILRRGSREASYPAAVRPVRVERRHRPVDGAIRRSSGSAASSAT